MEEILSEFISFPKPSWGRCLLHLRIETNVASGDEFHLALPVLVAGLLHRDRVLALRNFQIRGGCCRRSFATRILVRPHRLAGSTGHRMSFAVHIATHKNWPEKPLITGGNF